MSKSRRSFPATDVAGSYLEHRRFLKRFLTRFLSSPDDIEDVLQETFLRSYRAEGRTDIRSPRAFLTRIARNVALKELGRRARQVTGYIEDVAATEVMTDGTSVDEQVAQQERLAVFCRAAASLPPQCRRAFLMRKVYGFSHQEIASALNISVSTVEKHLATGLMRCNDYMAARGHQPLERRSAKAGRS